MIVRFVRGLTYPVRGARLVYVTHRGLLAYGVVPILLTLAALVGALWAAFAFGADLLAVFWSPEPASGIWGSVVVAIHRAAEWVVAMLLATVGVFVAVSVSGVLAAPFNDALSRRVETIRGHATAGPEGLKFLLRDGGRTLRLEGVKLMVYGLLVVPLFVLSLFLPGIGQLAYSGVAAMISVLYLASDYVDWPAARRDWPLRRRLRLFRRFPGEMVGFGVGVWILLWVPILNICFMPAAVAGGTLLFLEVLSQSPENLD